MCKFIVKKHKIYKLKTAREDLKIKIILIYMIKYRKNYKKLV